MPWTLSHPAAVLPLGRFTPRPLNFAALVVGSMTPDMGFYIDRFDLSDFAHTLPGTFLACIPTGVIMLIFFYLFSRPVCYALPSPHRSALLPLCPNFPTGLKQWTIILFSLLLGAWTHNFWDAFTHENGWFVERIPWLQQSVTHLGSLHVHVYLALQEGSTVVGFVIVVLAYCFWLRRQPASPSPAAESDGWRYLFWLAVITLSFLIAVPLAVHESAVKSLHDFIFLRSIIFHTATCSSTVALILILIGTSTIYLRHSH
jgi:hypothetical protein